MKFILIILALHNTQPNHHVEFDSMAACEHARDRIIAAFPLRTELRERAFCVPKE